MARDLLELFRAYQWAQSLAAWQPGWSRVMSNAALAHDWLQRGHGTLDLQHHSWFDLAVDAKTEASATRSCAV